MQAPTHSMKLLFNQLGLEGTSKAIAYFIDNNTPIANDVKLHEADFWTESQSLCLKEMINEDADWADVVDQRNLLMPLREQLKRRAER